MHASPILTDRRNDPDRVPALVSAPAEAADECRIYAKQEVQEGTFFQEEGVWQWCLPPAS